MSENEPPPPTEEPLQPLPMGGQMAKMQCPSCKKQMDVVLPPSRIFNGPDVSIIAFPHQMLDKCADCGSKYLCTVEGFDKTGVLNFKWVRVEVRQNPSAIATGTDAEMKQAIQNSRLSEAMKTESEKKQWH